MQNKASLCQTVKQVKEFGVNPERRILQSTLNSHCWLFFFIPFCFAFPSFENFKLKLKSYESDKTNKMMCTQRKLRSAFTSAQSDQSLRCPHEETMGPWLFLECTAKTDHTGQMPRIVWVNYLGANVILLVLLCAGSYVIWSILHFLDLQQRCCSLSSWHWNFGFKTDMETSKDIQMTSKLLHESHLPRTSFEPHHEKTCLLGFATRYDSNRPAQLQKLARVLKIWI